MLQAVPLQHHFMTDMYYLVGVTLVGHWPLGSIEAPEDTLPFCCWPVAA